MVPYDSSSGTAGSHFGLVEKGSGMVLEHDLGFGQEPPGRHPVPLDVRTSDDPLPS